MNYKKLKIENIEVYEMAVIRAGLVGICLMQKPKVIHAFKIKSYE